MTDETVSTADIEIARILHAALGMYLASNGAGPIPENEPLLYSPEQAAERLGLESTNLLYRRTADGTWPYTPVGKFKKFSEADLQQIVEIQSRDAVSAASRRKLRTA